MDEKNKGIITIIGWLSYLGVIVYLANIMGPVAIPFAAIMIAPLVVMMNFLWGKKGQQDLANMRDVSATEKRKRERIDHMIRDMSDEELYQLRRRLQDGSYDDEMFYEHIVGEDGELIRR